LPWQSLTRPADRQRHLAAAVDIAETLCERELLLSIAGADPSSAVRARLETASETFDANYRIKLLIALAKTDPTGNRRLLATAETSVDELSPGSRQFSLAAIAMESPGDRQRLARAAEAAADLEEWSRPWALVAIAETHPPDRQRLLADAEAAAADLDPEGRSGLLTRIAKTDPTRRRRVAATEAATAVATGHVEAEDPAQDLVAIARLNPSPSLLAGIEAAAAHLEPAVNGRS